MPQLPATADHPQLVEQGGSSSIIYPANAPVFLDEGDLILLQWRGRKIVTITTSEAL